MADSKSNLIEFMQAFDRLIPMDSGANSSGDSSPNKIPTWAVKILEYTESAIHGFEDYCALRGFYARTSRGTNMAAKTDILSSNTLRHSHVILYIPRGNLQTKLESHIFKSMPISKITIVNIAEMNGVIGKLQEIEYEQCYVQQLEPMLDWLLVELKITKYSNTLYKYGTDGRLEGKDMATMDYTLNPKIDVHIYSNRPSEDDEDHSEQDEHEADSPDDADLTKPEDKIPEEEEQSQVDSVEGQAQEADNGASSQDDSKKEDPQPDSQADVLNTLDNIQQNGLESVLPPESQNALSAVKALASGDQEALTQSTMSLLGVDQKRANQVNQAGKLLANLEGLKKKGVGGVANGGDSSSGAASGGGDSGSATGGSDSSSAAASGGGNSGSATGGDSSSAAASGGGDSGSAAGGDSSSAAASGGGDSGGAAGGDSSSAAASGNGNPVSDNAADDTSTDSSKSGKSKKKKKSLLDDIVKKTDESQKGS